MAQETMGLATGPYGFIGGSDMAKQPQVTQINTDTKIYDANRYNNKIDQYFQEQNQVASTNNQMPLHDSFCKLLLVIGGVFGIVFLLNFMRSI